MGDRILADNHNRFATEPTYRLLTTADVARMLHLSAQGVRWLTREGHLTCDRTPSGQRLFRPSEVQRVADRRMEARRRGLSSRRRARWSGHAEPRQLALFGAELRLVGGRERRKGD